MKPKSRLLIQFRFPDGSMKGWGYDYPYYNKIDDLKAAIIRDFDGWPAHDEIHLFYYQDEGVITSDNPTDLAEDAVAWLQATGNYNGN
jgi:hypothetical protein